jgi:predicted PurR-regulated permease PerM
MKPEWIAVILTALAMTGVVVKVLFAVLSTVKENTNAIVRLNATLEKQDARIERLDERVDGHDVEIAEIKSVHKGKGCII